MKVRAEKLKTSFYVYNCVTSVETENELRKFVEEAKKLMMPVKFELRGWINAQVTEKKRKLGEKQYPYSGCCGI